MVPQVLASFGYAGAIWNLFDGTPLPDPATSRIRWEGSGDAAIDAVARAPLDARLATTVLQFADKLGEILAEAHALLSCAREMNLKAAWLCDNGLPYASEANTAKFIGARGLELATERAMKSMGGMGYARASYVERLWRDAWLSQVAPIPEEMILNFIAQQDLGLPRSY